jgi:glycosyltransferase involved in cell wall biosynthesis
MRILFLMGDPHMPQFTGGAQSSSHELALEFMKRGHQVAVLCQLIPRGRIGLQNRMRRRLLKRNAVSDKVMGYPVFRQWNVGESVADVVREFRPDVALVQIGRQMVLARELAACDVPTLVYIRTAEMEELEGDPRSVPGVGFIANSQFTADRFRAHFGMDSAVIPPFFIADHYKVRNRGRHVTFVNPHALKGFDIAKEVARRCPDIKFLFVESWTLQKKDRARIKTELASLPNVRYRRRASDMKRVYAQTKIVLMPSRWDEAWGRVASEAQFSGIPVVASNKGGLPESVGTGGILLDPDGPIEPWVQTIRRLWDDESHYADLSAAALSYTRRPEIDPSLQSSMLLHLMEGVIQAKKSTPEQSRALPDVLHAH